MSFANERLLRTQRYSYYFIFTIKPPFLTNDKPKILHTIWHIISWICMFLPLHLSFCNLKTVLDDNDLEFMVLINFAVESGWFFFSFLCLVHYKSNQNNLAQLLNDIDEAYKWRSPKGRSYVEMEKTYKFAKYISHVWQCVAPSFVFLSIMIPLFVKPIGPQMWYPLNQEDPFQYVLSVLVQGWTKMVMVVSFSGGSSLFVSFCVLTCGQFDILRCALKNIIYTSGVYESFEETQVRFTSNDVVYGEYTLSEEREDEQFPLHKTEDEKASVSSKKLDLTPEEIRSIRKALNNCVDHHHKLLNICERLNDFFSLFAFYRVTEMTLQICFLAYLYPKVHSIIPFSYFLLTFIDIFMITYPAEHVLWHSECVGGAILLGPWHLVSKYFYRDFIIMMAITSRPIKFSASPMLNLDVACLKGVITTAFSYYTLLTKYDP